MQSLNQYSLDRRKLDRQLRLQEPAHLLRIFDASGSAGDSAELNSLDTAAHTGSAKSASRGVSRLARASSRGATPASLRAHWRMLLAANAFSHASRWGSTVTGKLLSVISQEDDDPPPRPSGAAFVERVARTMKVPRPVLNSAKPKRGVNPPVAALAVVEDRSIAEPSCGRHAGVAASSRRYSETRSRLEPLRTPPSGPRSLSIAALSVDGPFRATVEPNSRRVLTRRRPSRMDRSSEARRFTTTSPSRMPRGTSRWGVFGRWGTFGITCLGDLSFPRIHVARSIRRLAAA